MARDGVTTALELEGGAYPVERWYAVRAGKARIHFGASVSHGGVRARVLRDTARIRATGGVGSVPDSQPATYETPGQPSAGIVHVLVNGTAVVRNAALVAGVAPGQAIRR